MLNTIDLQLRQETPMGTQKNLLNATNDLKIFEKHLASDDGLTVE